MKRALVLLYLMILQPTCLDAEKDIGKELANDDVEYETWRQNTFGSAVDYFAECYVVCVYKVSSSLNTNPVLARHKWEQLHIECTVVKTIKGTKSVSEKFKFTRALEGKAGDVSSMIGGLYFVFFSENEQKRIYVDPQDYSVMWQYSQAYLEIAEKVVGEEYQKAEQVAAPQD